MRVSNLFTTLNRYINLIDLATAFVFKVVEFLNASGRAGILK